LRNADSVNDLRLKIKLNSKIPNPESQDQNRISNLDIL
jgi:twitching motility protein PilU